MCFVRREEGAPQESLPVAEYVFTHPPCADEVAQRILHYLLEDWADVWTRAVLRERVLRLIPLTQIRWLASAVARSALLDPPSRR